MFSLREAGSDISVAVTAITEIQVKQNSTQYELWAYTSGGRTFKLDFGNFPTKTDALAARDRLLFGDFTL